MIKYDYDSIQSEALKKLIDEKIKYYQSQLKAGNHKAAQYMQKEIVFLRDEILPLVLHNSSIHHWELASYTIRNFEAAVKFECNGLLIYIPTAKVTYDDQPIIAIANPLQFERYGMQVWLPSVKFNNMDGNGPGVIRKDVIEWTLNGLT